MWGERLLLAVAAALVQRARGQAYLLELSGACDYMGFLNGLRFQMQGSTASGAPYYKAETQDYYIYHDPNCMGGSDGTPRWIIDNDAPSLTATQDLDGDGDCAFHARTDSTATSMPPASAPWRMYCNGGWSDRQLTLAVIQELAPTSTMAPTTTTTRAVAYMLQVDGACSFLNWLNGMVFERMGYTASGAPYYKSMTASFYIYYDPDCQGATEGFPRWIIDNDEPSLIKTEDLDSDNDCVYQARVDSGDSTQPPASASWHMHCNANWEDHQVTLMEITTTSTFTSSTATATTQTTTTATVTTSLSSTATATSTATSTGTATEAAAEAPEPANGTAANGTAANGTTAAPAPANGTAANGTAQPSQEPAAEAEDEEPATCEGFACPLGTVLRANVSGVVNASNATCCEAPATTPAPTTSTAATTAMASATTAPAAPSSSSSPAPASSSAAETTTAEPTAAAAPPDFLQLAGACAEQGPLNGQTFQRQGSTASGAPYYKAMAQDFYIYYDPDCKSAGSPPRWIIDSNAPNTTASSDLDGDGGCSYHARMNAAGLGAPPAAGPPELGTWRMHCSAWQDQPLVLSEVEAPPATTTAAPTEATEAPTAAPNTSAAPASPRPAAPAAGTKDGVFELSGGCEYMGYLRGMSFSREGETASGAPYFKAEGQNYFVYYDPDCAGDGGNPGRWIIDDNAPSTTTESDLDEDQDCSYLARVLSESLEGPPLSAEWRMYCGSDWQDQPLALREAYVQLSSGSCAEAGLATISDVDACSAAASFLGLSDQAPEIVAESPRPEGCHYDVSASRLHISLDPANLGVGASSNLQPICSSGEEADLGMVSAAAGLPGPALLAVLCGLAALAA